MNKENKKKKFKVCYKNTKIAMVNQHNYSEFTAGKKDVDIDK